MPKPLLSLKNINKYFGDFQALKDITIDIQQGEFLTLLGPSGCGKTTLLRCIAGLETVDSGDILLNGVSIKDLAPNKRNVNTVFQNYALFPHLNVYDNIAYGPRVKKSMAESQLKIEVNRVLDLVQMIGYEQRMTNQLSGGQRQRIAIARALINQPDILLLDEPLGALDLKLRKHMQTELAQIQKKTGTTFVYVTHDQDEALNMSDRIVVIEHGKLQQLGSPRKVYNDPSNLFVAEFIGDRNIMEVEVLQVESATSKIKLVTNIISVRSSPKAPKMEETKTAVLAIHKDKMKISCDRQPNSLVAKVLSIHYAGSQIRIQVQVDKDTITVIEYQQGECEYKEEDTVYLSWNPKGAVLLPLEADWRERDLA